MYYRFIVVFALITSCIACSSNKKPTDTDVQAKDSTTTAIKKKGINSIRLRNEMGLVPSYTTLYLSPDSCVLEKGDFRNPPEKIRFTVTPDEWENLRRLLEKQDYPTIKTRLNEKVADRGGMTLDVEYADQVKVTVSNANTSFVTEEDMPRWQAIIDRLREVVMEKTGKKI